MNVKESMKPFSEQEISIIVKVMKPIRKPVKTIIRK